MKSEIVQLHRYFIKNRSNMADVAIFLLKCCGMDQTVLDYGCRKTKKLIWGMEGKILWLMAAWLPHAPTSHQYTEKTQLNLSNFHLGNRKYFPFRQCLKETRFRSDLTLTIESHLKLTYVHTVSTVPLKNDSTIKNMK